MTLRDDRVSLRQMYDHAGEVIGLVKGRARADLDSDRIFSLAVTRLVQIVGEAAACVSDEGRKRHGDIPWAQIVGFRNRIVHGYDAIDHDILWQVLTADLPGLVDILDRIVGGDRT